MFRGRLTHPLKNVFNKIFWDKRENPRDYKVFYTHRGVEGNVKSLLASRIVNVGKGWFSFNEEDREVKIPFHRVVLVVNVKTNKVLWRKV